MSGIIQQSFAMNLRVMQYCRLYSPKQFTVMYKIQAYLMHLLFVSLVPTLGIFYLMLENDLDLEKVNYNAGFLAQATCFITKLLPFITNAERIKSCIEYFDSPKFRMYRNTQQRIIDKCIYVCKRNTLVFITCVAGGVSSWAVKPIFWNGRNLPVDIWLPFDFTRNYVIYSGIYVLLVVAVLFSSIATSVVDPLIAGLMYHATSQIKILKDNLQHLVQYAEEDLCEYSLDNLEKLRKKNKIIYENIKHAINHHNEILSFIKDYEKCFSPVLLSQIAASVFVICFSCLQLSKVEAFGYYFVQLVMYFSVILAQIYFYCYYGSTLFEESNTLTNAVYMGSWYDYEEKSKRALAIIMQRSKEPISVTVVLILDLSLVTFATILKRSYSLLAVLKNY